MIIKTTLINYKMELTTARRDLSHMSVGDGKSWALAIRQRYGDLQSFAMRFPPAVQAVCASNTKRAVENDVATFGRIVATYGEREMAGLISTHIADAIIFMGEEGDVDPNDIRFTAESICSGERFRTLRFPSIFGFFHLLKTGEFDIYGKVTPRKILEAFRKYAERQQAKEDRFAYEKQCREEEAERKARSAGAVSWKEYATLRGIKDRDYMSYAARTAREYRDAKSGVMVFLECVKSLTDILSFVSDLMQIKKIS